MYDNGVIAEFKKVVGWKDHYSTDVPALTPSLTISDSNRYFNDGSFHPLVRLDYIQSMLDSKKTLEYYLDEVVDAACNNVLTNLAALKGLTATGKELVTSKLIHQQVIRGDNITNEGRFCGVQFRIKDAEGIRLTLNRVGLYLTAAQPSLTLYLFNSLQEDVVKTVTYTSTAANSFQWLETGSDLLIDFDDGSNNSGAVWYLGYYQNDLIGNAIQYKTLNWINGFCGTCGSNNSNSSSSFKKLSKYASMMPFYVAAGSLPAVGKLFSHEDMIECSTNNFGFNFNITVSCNLSRFWIDNRLTFADAIGKAVALSVLEMIAASSQSSAVEQNLQPMALRAIEADNNTKQTTFRTQVTRALKVIHLDEGNVNNNPCLPCARKGGRTSSL